MNSGSPSNETSLMMKVNVWNVCLHANRNHVSIKPTHPQTHTTCVFAKDNPWTIHSTLGSFVISAIILRAYLTSEGRSMSPWLCTCG